jgi:hypothetical protein
MTKSLNIEYIATPARAPSSAGAALRAAAAGAAMLSIFREFEISIV